MSESKIIRPDGFSAQAEPHIVQLHGGPDAMQFPFPTDSTEEVAKQCLVKVQTPVGPAAQFALTPQAALVLLETSKALKERDQLIEQLVHRVEALEQQLEDDIEAVRAEGFDG